MVKQAKTPIRMTIDLVGFIIHPIVECNVVINTSSPTVGKTPLVLKGFITVDPSLVLSRKSLNLIEGYWHLAYLLL